MFWLFCAGSYCRSYLCYLEQIPDGSVWAAGQWEPRGHLAPREAPLDGFQTRPDTPVSSGSPTPTHIQSQCHSLISLRLWSMNENESRKQLIFCLTAGNEDNWFRSSQSSLRLGRAPRVSGWEIKCRLIGEYFLLCVCFFVMTSRSIRINCFDLPKLPVHYCPDPAVPVLPGKTVSWNKKHVQ